MHILMKELWKLYHLPQFLSKILFTCQNIRWKNVWHKMTWKVNLKNRYVIFYKKALSQTLTAHFTWWNSLLWGIAQSLKFTSEKKISTNVRIIEGCEMRIMPQTFLSQVIQLKTLISLQFNSTSFLVLKFWRDVTCKLCSTDVNGNFVANLSK